MERPIHPDESQSNAAPSGEDGTHADRSTVKSAEQLAREQKIAALKRAIESGTYRVEPDKVAQAIIADLAQQKR